MAGGLRLGSDPKEPENSSNLSMRFLIVSLEGCFQGSANLIQSRPNPLKSRSRFKPWLCRTCRSFRRETQYVWLSISCPSLKMPLLSTFARTGQGLRQRAHEVREDSGGHEELHANIGSDAIVSCQAAGNFVGTCPLASVFVSFVAESCFLPSVIKPCIFVRVRPPVSR